MEITSLILTAVILSALCGVICLRQSRYLTFFYFICFSLPFLPLISSIFGDDSVFWIDDTFSFDSSSIQVFGLTVIWLYSSLGMLLALTLRKIVGHKAAQSKARPASISHLDMRITQQSMLWKIAMLSLAISVAARSVFAAQIEAMFPGMDPLICYMFVFCWAVVLVHPSRKSLIYLVSVTTVYVTSQLISGDRDFFTFIFALGLLWMVWNKVAFKTLFKIAFVVFALVVTGAVISIVRMEIEFSYDQILVFLRFNSWNAIILPVLSMIEAEWLDGKLLYGKPYIDLLFSALPSPIFNFLGIIKPINLDNPAEWFYIQGLGGMHVAGVAFRNFDLVGVLAQSFFLTTSLMLVEKLVSTRTSSLRVFLFLVVATATMHATWYGLIYLVNALTFYIYIIMMVYVFTLLGLISPRKYKIGDFSS